MVKENSQETVPAKAEPASVRESWGMHPLEEFGRLFDDFSTSRWMRPWRWDRPHSHGLSIMAPRTPRVDVVERDSEVLVRAEVPGIDRKDLDVSVTENTATIKGQSSRETKEESGDYYRCEIERGAFARTVPLPASVDADKAQATFSDGILELTIPKMKESRRRKVEVKQP